VCVSEGVCAREETRGRRRCTLAEEQRANGGNKVGVGPQRRRDALFDGDDPQGAQLGKGCVGRGRRCGPGAGVSLGNTALWRRAEQQPCSKAAPRLGQQPEECRRHPRQPHEPLQVLFGQPYHTVQQAPFSVVSHAGHTFFACVS